MPSKISKNPNTHRKQNIPINLFPNKEAHRKKSNKNWLSVMQTA
jgi:hypothetical protein